VGVVAFVAQVIGATEAYFCPIKHHEPKLLALKKRVLYLTYEEPDDFDFDGYLEEARKPQTDDPRST
jgi:hypothetical protein